MEWDQLRSRYQMFSKEGLQIQMLIVPGVGKNGLVTSRPFTESTDRHLVQYEGRKLLGWVKYEIPEHGVRGIRWQYVVVCRRQKNNNEQFFLQLHPHSCHEPGRRSANWELLSKE